MLGVVSMDTLPDTHVPEVAFAGRSNVGKSSLINALTGRKQLARASTEPGRTRELNFFDMHGRLRIVDLPGYGFAKAPKEVAARWTRLTQNYLRGRVNLKRVFLDNWLLRFHRPCQSFSLCFHHVSAAAAFQVVVDHAHGLHEA